MRAVFGERWEDAHARLVRAHAESENGGAPPPGFGYRILPCLVKTGEGLLQEQFAIQLVRMFQDVYDAARLPLGQLDERRHACAAQVPRQQRASQELTAWWAV